MAFFTIQDDAASLLLPKPFAQQFTEDDLQRWADKCPGLLNDGMPMLSLGREVATTHGHYIDNLYLDGNGTLVVAELKRGRNTRDVHAQVIEYGAYANQLDWNDLDKLCLNHHNQTLTTQFENMFGRSLDVSGKVEHRLLIVAESYDQRALDMGRYLETQGLSITFLEFTHYDYSGGTVMQTRIVQGTIPEQVPAGIKVSGKEDRATSAYNKWLFSKVAVTLAKIADDQGWDVQYRINKQSISFVNSSWPVSYGALSMSVATWAKDTVTPWLYADDKVLPDLGSFLKENKNVWHDAFPAE